MFKCLLLAICATFSLQVAAIGNQIPLILLFSSSVISVLYFFINRKIIFYTDIGAWMTLFLIPSLIIPTIGLFSLFTSDQLYDYNQINFMGRIANIVALVIFILTITHLFRNKPYMPIKFYWFGTAILVLSGIWQLLSFYNILPFPFETRTNLHSSGGLRDFYVRRLTGIAREPSYFSPIAIDFFILSFLFFLDRKKKLFFMLLISTICLYFTFSPTAYIVFSLSIAGAYLSMSSFKKKLILIPLFFFGFNLFLSTYGGLYFLHRIVLVEDDPRYYMVLLPFRLISESDVFSFFFGYGIKSYSIIGERNIYNINTETTFATSNNIFSDIFFESGLLGLSMICFFFIYIYNKIVKSRISYIQKYIAFFVYFDLLGSSFFRADFATLRFFILIYIIHILVNIDFARKHVEY